LLGEKHPIAQDALDILRRFPGMPTWSPRTLLGGMRVDDVYVYPLERGRPVEITIYGMTFREHPSSVWSFAKHNIHGFRFLREPT
jgi:hypothetical protein